MVNTIIFFLLLAAIMGVFGYLAFRRKGGKQES